MVALPTATAEEKESAAADIKTLGPTCSKIQMNPTACNGCPDNPVGDRQKGIDNEALKKHAIDIDQLSELHGVVRMGLTTLDKIDDEDWLKLRSFWWTIENSRQRLM